MDGTTTNGDIVAQADRPRALRIVQALRQGSNCLEGAGFFSAGRDMLFRAAADSLEELELSGGAVVKWVKGRYEQGKTHFFARLIEIAHKRNWVTSYVQVSGRSQGAEFHRFEEIYAAIVRNCLCRDLVLAEQGRVEPGRIPGWEWILDDWFRKLRILATGAEHGDVPTFRLRDVIDQTMTGMRRNWGVHGSFAEALRQFAQARVDGDADWAQYLLGWFSGQDVHSRGGEVRARLVRSGIRERISRRNAKEMLRNMSAFVRYRGFGGTLILLDEVENVLLQPSAGRRAAYTILRELIDNVDDRHGMMCAAFYISGTPDLFESEKGIAEYEALASRVLMPAGDAPESNPAGSILDLASMPLSRTELLDIATGVTSLHAAAKNWEPGAEIRTRFEDLLAATSRHNPDFTIRTWVRSVVDLLDRLSSVS